MKTWTDFLADLLFSKGKDNWWPLGDEHLNHLLLAMLIKYEPKFLERYLGKGSRNLLKVDFGSRWKRSTLGHDAAELDIHVEVSGITTLIEIKTWSSIKKHQSPEAFAGLIRNTDNYKILYILLTDEATKSYPQSFSPDIEKSGRISVMTRSDLIEALDQVSKSNEVGLIASDYAQALRLLTKDKGWSR